MLLSKGIVLSIERQGLKFRHFWCWYQKFPYLLFFI